MITKASVEERVRAIVVEKLDVKKEELEREASFFDDLGADSLDAVELIMGFEEEFDIEIPDEEAQKIHTIQEAIDHVSAHLGATED